MSECEKEMHVDVHLLLDLNREEYHPFIKNIELYIILTLKKL